MKKSLTIILFLLFSLSIIKCTDDKKNLNKTKESITEDEDNKDNDNETEEIDKDDTNDEEEENAKEEESGFYISDKVFEEKLNIILQEKNLKPKKKITKEQLRTIFSLIYKKEKKGDENEGIDPETGLTPEEQDKQYMDSIFNQVTKSLDYDDKIRVKEIKDWIPPIKVQEAYAELLQGLAETMGYL